MDAGESFATSDSVSCVVLFGRAMRAAVRGAAGIGLTGYRILAYLGQHPEGAMPGELSAMTGLSGGTVSLALDDLRERGLVASAEGGTATPSPAVTRTREGARIARSCDAALSAAYGEFFAPLGDKLRADLLSGSLVTTAHLGVTRMEGNSYFAQYSVLIGFLRNEQYLMNTTRKFGLGMGEYRVLLALYEHPSMDRPGALRNFLVAHKSELSNWCKSLEGKGLASAAAASLDRRGKAWCLTATGAKLVEDVHDAMSLGEVRPVQPGEISLYNGMFHIIMDDIRQKRRH